MPRRGLVLYTRLPDYFYQCLMLFCDQHKVFCDVVVYAQDSNTEFRFEPSEYIRIYERANFNPKDFLGKDYSFILTTTWNDREYKDLCRRYYQDCPVILGMDNPWTGHWKQYVHAILSRFTVLRYFNRIWVPGVPQIRYARKLGFKTAQIAMNFYSADDSKFLLAKSPTGLKERKRILFIGRFVEYKRPLLLASVFKKMLKTKAIDKNWQLVLVGRGPLGNKLLDMQDDNVTVKDFVGPEDLPALLQESSFFCLPSENEHWGVVVHEAAFSGLPLLLSDTVYAGTAFLEEGRNGFIFTGGSAQSLWENIVKITSADLDTMGGHSIEKALQVTRQVWSDTLMQIITGFDANKK